jgi:hypothetical protein
MQFPPYVRYATAVVVLYIVIALISRSAIPNGSVLKETTEVGRNAVGLVTDAVRDSESATAAPRNAPLLRVLHSTRALSSLSAALGMVGAERLETETNVGGINALHARLEMEQQEAIHALTAVAPAVMPPRSAGYATYT